MTALLRSIHATPIDAKELICPAMFNDLLQRILDNEACGRHDPVEVSIVRGYYGTAYRALGRKCACIQCRTIASVARVKVALPAKWRPTRGRVRPLRPRTSDDR